MAANKNQVNVANAVMQIGDGMDAEDFLAGVAEAVGITICQITPTPKEAGIMCSVFGRHVLACTAVYFDEVQDEKQ